MKIFLNKMICRGTRFFILIELDRLGLNFTSLESGEVEIERDITVKEIRSLDDSLSKYGLELVLRNSRIIYGVREAVLDLAIIHSDLRESLSSILSEKTEYNNTLLNKGFNVQAGSSVEKYFIVKKLERIKLIQSKLSDLLSITNSEIHQNDIYDLKT